MKKILASLLALSFSGVVFAEHQTEKYRGKDIFNITFPYYMKIEMKVDGYGSTNATAKLTNDGDTVKMKCNTNFNLPSGYQLHGEDKILWICKEARLGILRNNDEIMLVVTERVIDGKQVIAYDFLTKGIDSKFSSVEGGLLTDNLNRQ